LQGLPGCLPWGMVLTFFNDYLSYDKGLSIGMATLVVLLFGLGGAIGGRNPLLARIRGGGAAVAAVLPCVMGAAVLAWRSQPQRLGLGQAGLLARQEPCADLAVRSSRLCTRRATTARAPCPACRPAGTVAGGALGQYLYNRRKEYMPLLMGLGVLGGMAPLYAVINADFSRVGMGFIATMSMLAGLVSSLPVPNVRAVVLNVNEPELRGIAMALQALTDDVGKGLGPFIVALFISAVGRQAAFNMAVAGWVPCALLMLGLCFTMRRDEAAMQKRLQRSMKLRQSRAGGLSSAGGGGGLQFEEDSPGLPISTAPAAAARAAAAALATGASSRKQEVLMVSMRSSPGLHGGGGAAEAPGGPNRGRGSTAAGAGLQGQESGGPGIKAARSSGLPMQEASRGAPAADVL
jgi:hypothetical protein